LAEQLTVKLVSDFKDYYDASCNVVRNRAYDYIWDRRQRNWVGRRKLLDVLGQAGFRLPLRGTARKVAGNTRRSHLVVYTDEFAHEGQGKVLLPAFEAAEEYAANYCTEYVGPTPHRRATSVRILQVGNRAFRGILSGTMKTGSTWRSNVADEVQARFTDSSGQLAEIKPIEAEVLKPYPLFAVDLVPDEAGNLFAVDFNTAPRLGGTDLGTLLGAQVLTDLVREHVARHGLFNGRSYRKTTKHNP
jgi:hypothetical protein